MSISVAILAPSPVPFQIGGAEKFWLGMQRGLMECSGNFTELIKLPSREDTYSQLLDAYQMFHEIDLTHFDMVISTKYPAWMVRHYNHVVYLQHPLRGLYDTYHFTGLPETLNPVPGPLRSLMRFARLENPDTSDCHAVFELARKALAVKSLPSSLFAFPGPLIREIIHFFDRFALHPDRVASYFAISETVKNRKDYFPPQAMVRVIHHPPELSDFFCQPGKYIFTASRLNAMKRIELLVRAMRHVKADVPLKIAGTGPELDKLKRLAGADQRIQFLGHVPDRDLPGLYSNAICVPFVPYDEDYGLITIEAMKSAKPVVTTTDAGGVLEFVEDGVTGYRVEPNPQALGQALDRLASDTELARRMGLAALEKVKPISWEKVASSIFFHNAAASLQGKSERPGIVICAPFEPDRQGSGGQRRLYHLCAQLAADFDVTLIRPASWNGKAAQTRCLMPGVSELAVPWMEATLDDVESLRRITGESVDDLALMRHCADDALMVEAIAAACRNSFCIILSHPWLYPAVRKAGVAQPLVYDAHNVEAALKDWLFAGKRPDLAQAVKATEGDLCRASALVCACSSEDCQRLAQLYALDKNVLLCAPNGCDSEALSFASPAKRRKLRARHPYPDQKLALFIGSGHKPNLESAEFICELGRQLPEIQFLIGGGVGLAPEIRHKPKPANVHLLGPVSEEVKNLLLNMADVSINPAFSGSGTNLKLIEYIQAGIPCVSTPFGARGLADAQELLHICEPEDFAAAIKDILARPPEADFEQKSRRIAQKYSWLETFRPLRAALLALAEN